MDHQLAAIAHTAQSALRIQWRSEKDHFWYRRGSNPIQYIRVSLGSLESSTSRKKVVLDMDSLAAAYSKVKNKPPKASDINLTHLYLSNGFIQFYDGEDHLDFDGISLTISDPEIIRLCLKIGPDWDSPPATEKTGPETFITCFNNRSAVLELYWVDYQGKRVHYRSIQPGQSQIQQTYEHHVWQIVVGDEFTTFAATADAMTVRTGKGCAMFEFSLEPAGALEPRGTSAPDKSAKSTTSVKDPTKLVTSHTPSNGSWWWDGDDKSPNGKLAVIYPRMKQLASQEWMKSITSPQQKQSETTDTKTDGLVTAIDTLGPPILQDLVRKETVPLDYDLVKDPSWLLEIGWSRDSSEYRFIYIDRDESVLRVVGLSRRGVRTIIEERNNTPRNTNTRPKCDTSVVGTDADTNVCSDAFSKFEFHYSQETNELIWLSDRDGTKRLYCVDMHNGAMVPLTPEGEFVRSVEHIDTETRQVWYSTVVVGSVESKDQKIYSNHLVRVNFNGSEYTRLTHGDGVHCWQWSPDRRYLVDTWCYRDDGMDLDDECLTDIKTDVEVKVKTVLRVSDTGEELTVL